MDPAGVIIIMLVGVVAGIVCGLGVGKYARRIQREHAVKSVRGDDDENARAIDPSNPPRWKTYSPQPGRPAIQCTCHDRDLQPGERVLWWPIKHGQGAVDLFCTETVQEAGT